MYLLSNSNQINLNVNPFSHNVELHKLYIDKFTIFVFIAFNCTGQDVE